MIAKTPTQLKAWIKNLSEKTNAIYNLNSAAFAAFLFSDVREKRQRRFKKGDPPSCL